MNLWTYIRSKMLENPNQKICEETAEMTYEEVIIFCEHFAKKISNQKCCAILCDSEMMSGLALLSCFAASVTAVPLSARYGETHCKKILETIEPTAIITDREGELSLLKFEDDLYKKPETDIALIMCTSGTTGRPKGAMLTEKNILTNLKDICKYFKIDCSDYILISRPLYHCAVLTGEFLTALVKGVKIRFYSKQFNPKQLIDIINYNSITVFCATPTLVGMMARFNRTSQIKKLKTICISGECMGSYTGKKISEAFPTVNIYHVYGLTEACPRVSYLPPEYFNEYSDCVGIPLNSVSIKIIKADGKEAQCDEDGILWIKGDNIMQGYHNSPQQTAKIKKNGWLCTGDVARVNSKGFLKIKGRNDDLIIKAGMNIYPQEIEGTLKSNNKVKEVLVYKIDNEKYGVQIGLKIVGDFKNIKEVKELCIKTLPAFQIPNIIEIVEELPKNASGKIIRRV